MDMQKNMGRRRILGRALAAAATLALALGLSACGGAPAAGSDAQAGSESQREAKTVVFTDSAGREVEVPANIERVVPSGHTATQVLITLAPEKLAGLPQEITQDQRAYLTDAPDESLPVLGAAFGSKGDLNKEAVAATGAQVLIDTGEYKEGIEEIWTRCKSSWVSLASSSRPNWTSGPPPTASWASFWASRTAPRSWRHIARMPTTR